MQLPVALQYVNHTQEDNKAITLWGLCGDTPKSKRQIITNEKNENMHQMKIEQ